MDNCTVYRTKDQRGTPVKELTAWVEEVEISVRQYSSNTFLTFVEYEEDDGPMPIDFEDAESCYVSPGIIRIVDKVPNHIFEQELVDYFIKLIGCSCGVKAYEKQKRLFGKEAKELVIEWRK